MTVEDPTAALARAVAAIESEKQALAAPVAAKPDDGQVPSAPEGVEEVALPAPGPAGELVEQARQLINARIDTALRHAGADFPADVLRAVLASKGASVGLGDDGRTPTVKFPDGSEAEITGDALRKAGLPDSMTGRISWNPLNEGSARAAPAGDVLDGLRDQRSFEKNKRAILEEVARRNRLGKGTQ